MDQIFTLLGEAQHKLQAQEGLYWLRSNLGFSPIDMCRILGMSRKTYTRMEARETNSPHQNQHVTGILLLLTVSVMRHNKVGQDHPRTWADGLRHRCMVYGPMAALHTITEDNKELWA